MGLTIHYHLQAQPRSTKAQAHEIVNALQQGALTLLHEGLLAEVSEVRAANQETLKALVVNQTDVWNWAAIQSQIAISVGTGPYRLLHLVHPVEGFMFRTWPGPGCEAANFGLMRYPGRIETDPDHHGKPKESVSTGLSGWRWASFCKTTYAEQPVAAHLAVIAMLDYANDLPGLTVDVQDEGGYWDTRDVGALANTLLEDATMLAGLANALGPSAQAPIRERGDYGELVEWFQSQASNYDKTLEILKKLTRKGGTDT